jgi:WD40 repeat protein
LIDKKSALFTGGEGNEILVHEGFPFKGQGKSTGVVHSNFTNQLKVSPDNSKFVTVSSDKSIVVHDVATQAVLSKTDGAHEMGIYDVRWLDSAHIASCSADNTIKIWSVAADGAIEAKDTFVQHDGPKDTQYQLLGLAETKTGSLTAVNLNGDLVTYQDVTSAADKHPTSVSKRHTHLITDIVNYASFIVYASEHRIFYFDVSTPNDVRTVSGLPNKQNVLEFAQNSHTLYASTLDKFVLRL